MTKTLGAIQREVMRLLTDVPITPEDVAKKLGTDAGCDVGYYAATLIRLQEKGIARQHRNTWGFVQGYNWAWTMCEYRLQPYEDGDCT